MGDLLSQLRTSVADILDIDNTNEEDALLQQALNTVLTPVRILTSRQAVKTYLSVFLFVFASATLLSISTAAYLFFYYSFIPQVNLERPIYFQYGPRTYPYALIPLEHSQLISQQFYDVEILLHIPRTPSNLAAGNFMLDLTLLTNDPSAKTSHPAPALLPENPILSGQTSLGRSSRPAILPYASPITSLAHTFLHLPFHLFSVKDLDASNLRTPIFELLSFPRGRANVPTHAYVEIQTQIPPVLSDGCQSQLLPLQQSTMQTALGLVPAASGPLIGSGIQVYSAKLVFHAHFRGLRYVVYNYRVASFLVFTALFYILSVSSMVVAWAAITNTLHETDKKHQPLQQTKDEQRSDAVKEEPERKQGRMTHIPLYESRNATPDSSDAEHEARLRALTGSVTDPGHEAEDEEEEDQEGSDLALLRDMRLEFKREDGVGSLRETAGDSGIGTSLESEQPGPSDLVRRRSGRRDGDDQTR